jgi:hypothetical protein
MEEKKDQWGEAQDIPSSWMKFEKVGDSCTGTLVDKFEHEGNFGPQGVYVLAQEDGGMINVGVRVTAADFLNKKLKRVALGTKLIFKYLKDEPSKKFPGKTAKSIDAKILGFDEAFQLKDKMEVTEETDISFD